MPTSSPKPKSAALAHLKLGQNTDYPQHFDAGLLQPVPRQLNRDDLGIDASTLPFVGVDVWTCYELSWLQPNGVPAVVIAEVAVPATSPNLIESKSFKLYLNGFNQSTFANHAAVQQQLEHDLSGCAGAPVSVVFFTLDEYSQRGIQALPGHCIDGEDITIQDYDYQPDILLEIQAPTTAAEQTASETGELHSHVLKSNCLITNQPDWGSVYIYYTGKPIRRDVLLAYLVSFRNHNEFHEQCVERIYCDLQRYGEFSDLLVVARYTRRGGLDINPLRCSDSALLDHPVLRSRLARQ
ncbi:NADPH-dependent 7-cyano-7-deazaguanine reductase QueF [Aliidiomarina haloalkalitolerans]|uniref:NADPH-dependent 7-cyano-7-deazaguanine reductase n=1 Tax=Aliidiomarina haloalkalitolerans TaxID=859059 RepID=A0A432VXT0_9GAMM|nr:NADPH-dependent 7-cyano-7-deazaguanine reductase QueF [Aliidiomarina haloalkalitolerans]RUO21510.1 NADPH-dependent 7-cyano-7-deazaguanine reductase QueF [Aliidiomarina haloalkalitolerans]